MNSYLHKPDFFIDIFLQPGEFYFGDRETRIRTLLGSCVAITLWHPRLRIGGMCHYLLPMRRGKSERAEQPDGRYAEEAMILFLRELDLSASWPADYEVKMFGGGNQFPSTILSVAQEKTSLISVSDNNIHFGRGLLKRHGFRLIAEHLGGNGHRKLVFDVWSGHVWIQHFAKS
ncbi:chemotaxis protein CheD (plasmid) [Methylomonas sp. 2BW1-5-20]|uniref:chemotaxis protein CheD n=1 Tax=Methylomonas sp. 2BW1-5-20 TaxID=3376686 RepID=UPI0040528E48